METLQEEIQKLIEDFRSVSESLKLKESEVRRMLNELEISRKMMATFDIKLQ